MVHSTMSTVATGTRIELWSGGAAGEVYGLPVAVARSAAGRATNPK